jgi:uncharacterized protein (DUF2147 family)
VLRGTKTQSTKPSRLSLTLSVLLPALALAGGASAQTAPREAGLWYDDTGKGAVELVPCGPKLCGRIVWLKDQVNAEGKPLVDRYNPNPARRTTPICGLQVIGDAQRMPEGNWDSGWIYDPKTGASYNVTFALQGADQLKVTGYKGIKLLSKSFTWTRAPADLPRCAAAPAGEGAPEPTKGGEALPWAKE